jgi:hypothetical protein
MSGPVWRYEGDLRSSCDHCLREAAGLFVEGEVRDAGHHAERRICGDCYRSGGAMLVRGERGKRVPAPAYAHDA